MKVTLELTVGVETGVVIAALEQLAMSMNEAYRVLPEVTASKMYSDVAIRLTNTLEETIAQLH